nr:nucleotide-binding alpha-beta plait domain-containing protein [Tanacetum cinerariifolium]
METLGDRNEVSVVSENKMMMKKKKKVIRVVKKIVKKKVIKKVPKPKPECLVGVSSSNCDSFGSNDTSSVMDIEKAVENDDSSHSDRIQVPKVKEEEEKGVCLVENGYSCDQDRIDLCDKECGISYNSTDNDGMEIEKHNVVAEKLSEFENVKEEEEKGICLVQNDGFCDKERAISSNSTHNDAMEIEKHNVVAEKLSEFENVKEEEEKGICLVQNDGFRDKERAISSNSTHNEAMEIEKCNVVDKKLSEFENVNEEEEKGVPLVQNDGFCDRERATSSNSTHNEAMEIEKCNVVDKKLSEFENVNEEEEKGVPLVQNDGFCDRERAISSNSTDNDAMEIEKRNVVDKKMSEFENVNEEEKGVCLVQNDGFCDRERATSSNSTHNDAMEIEKRNVVDKKLSEFENVKEIGVSDKDIDARLCEKNGLSMDESEINGLVTSYLVSDQSGVELQDGDNNGIELQISDQNRVEDNETMDVKGHEGEEGVKEVVVNNETEGTELEQGLSESRVLSGQTVASWWHAKQRRKIFVHGLDKETKEDDIRKVFEKIGEVIEVKLITNLNSGKSRGFGFVRYASADLADLALTKFRHVEIRGSTWHTAAVEASDTIVLNNIDKKWNNDNVLSLLQKVGITKIDEVSVIPDPENSELNLGFAFIEFETKRDAQMAYRKLQIKNVFGEYSKIKVAWAESLADPVEEEMHNVKSVFAEYIPSSWDEKEVKDHFKMFGEIESIALAKNLHSAKRNDFAFINYKTCQAALSCIEALNNKRSTSENGLKAHPKVSLAKSIPKGKPVKIKSESAVTEASKVNQLSNESRPSRIRYQNASQSTPFHSPYQNASQSRPSHSPYQNASLSRPSHSPYQIASQSRPSHSPYQNASLSRPSHRPYQNASQSRPSHSPYQNTIQSRPSHSRYQNADQLRPSQGISGVCQPQKAIRSEVPSIVRHEASRKDEGSSTTNELVQLLREQASWKLGGPSSTAGMSTGHLQTQSGGKQLQLPTDLVQGRNALYLDPRSYHQTHLQMPNPTQPRSIQRAHYTHGYNVVEPNPRYIQKRDQATYPGNGSSFYR